MWEERPQEWRNWDYRAKIRKPDPQFLVLLESDVVFVPPTGGLQARLDRLVWSLERINGYCRLILSLSAFAFG